MLLKPKKVKYKKLHKKTLKNYDYKAHDLKFGTIGLKSLTAGTITSKQLESARQAISRKIKRKGKLWIRVFPHLSLTAKPTEARMGKGKGSIHSWAAKVKCGTVVFELCGIPFNLATISLKTGGAKLPVKTGIFN